MGRHGVLTFPSGKQLCAGNNGSHGEDGAGDACKLCTHDMGNDEFREGEGKPGSETDGKHAFDGFYGMSGDHDHEKGAEKREKEELQGDIGGNLHGIRPHDTGKGNDGDADGAVG